MKENLIFDAEQEEAIDRKYRIPIYKKSNESLGQKILRHRTVNQGLRIRTLLKDIPFEKLTLSLYFLCRDTKFNSLTHEYEKQIELAKLDFDKFMRGLYQFYSKMAVKIKKEDLYLEFFELFTFCGSFKPKNNGQEQNVIYAYISLLLQQIEFLRPNKFDPNKMFFGVKTDGTLMLTDDPFPLFDVPQIEVKTANYKNKLTVTQQFALLFELYHEYGYDIENLEDIEIRNGAYDSYVNNLTTMVPYINEYTADIASKKPLLLANEFVLRKITVDCTQLYKLLTKRRRTLPANGVSCQITGLDNINGFLFKEICHHDSICMLFKATTTGGDFSGLYNTREKYFYSYFTGSNRPDLNEYIEKIALFLYTALVCDDPQVTLEKFPTLFGNRKSFIRVNCFYDGGKLRNVYDGTPDNESGRSKRFDKEKYTYETRAIQGFVRRLPLGQTASEEAKRMAEAFGYDLKDNETYVRPFRRRTVILLPAK